MTPWRHDKSRSMSKDKTRKRLLVAAMSLVLYLILSLIYYGTTGNLRRMYLGWGFDPIAAIWVLNWWPWSIAHGLNPFISYYIWYPDGFNMTWANSMPSAALLIWPLTFLANAVVSHNVLSLLAPALAAWVGFLLARYLTQDTASSLIGGYLFGFSSYELGQMLGHLCLALIFVVPLLVLLVVQRIRRDISRRRFVAAIAFVLLVQLGLETEVLATACVFGAMTWVIFLAFAAPQERGRLWAVAWEIILAASVMAVIASPFLFFVFKDLAMVPAIINSPEIFSADLLNYLIPTIVTRFRNNFFEDLAKHFTGNAFEQGAYLGLPVILILLLQLRDIRRRPYVRPLLVTLLVILVLSLGPNLHVAGVSTDLRLPWHFALHLPLIHQALPTRFTMYVALTAALAVALWLSAARGGWDRVARFALALLACVSLVPNPAMIRWTPLHLEPFFQPRSVVASLGKHANVIMLPYGSTGPSMIWQWQSGMLFTQSGGYVGWTPPSESAWPVLQNFYAGIGGPSFENDVSAYCVSHNVSAILVGPGTPAALAAAVDALQWQQTNDHGVRIVRVPDPRLLHFPYITGEYFRDSWMGRQVSIVTHGQPVQLRITGRWRPLALGPVEIRVSNGSDVSRYSIAQQNTQVLSVPADATVTLTASATFVPDTVIHNGDVRNLSVAISLEQDARSVSEE
jgi:hypothetical protein